MRLINQRQLGETIKTVRFNKPQTDETIYTEKFTKPKIGKTVNAKRDTINLKDRIQDSKPHTNFQHQISS